MATSPLENILVNPGGASQPKPEEKPSAAQPTSLLGSTLAPASQEPVSYRNFGDADKMRSTIFDNVHKAISQKYPIENTRYRLEIHGLKYMDPDKVSIEQQKEAILKGQSLERRLGGEWHLIDKATNKVVDKKGGVIAHVPYATHRGTFIYSGNEYTVANQMRLKSGVYTRVKENGELEAHVNVKNGTGPSFRVYMEPSTGIFRLGVGQSTLKMYPILKAMGVQDKEIEKHWGKDLLKQNIEADDPRAVQRAYAKLVGTRGEASVSEENKDEDGEVKEAAFNKHDPHRICGLCHKPFGPPPPVAYQRGHFHRYCLENASIKALEKALLNKTVIKSAAEGEPEEENETEFKPLPTGNTHGQGIAAVFNKMELDPEVTQSTLGHPHKNADVPMLLRTSQKLLNVHKGLEDTDDRDSLAYQTMHGPEDFFAERVQRDAGMIGRKLLWKSTLRGHLKHMPSGALTPQLRGVLLRSGMGQNLEETNPLEIFDQHLRVLRLGEGGISSADAVPDESRNVQPSHFGFFDPIRAPESGNIGVDSRIAHGTVKGSDGRLYSPMKNMRTGKTEMVSAEQAAKSVVAFPGEHEREGDTVRAMSKAKQLIYVKKGEADYELPHPTRMFTASSNMVPMINSIKGGRLLMGAKFALQALPLEKPEAPLVQPTTEEGKSFADHYAEHVGAIKSKGDGVVSKMDRKGITVKYADGKEELHEIYDNFPFNRKSVTGNTQIIIRKENEELWRGPIEQYRWEAGDRVLSVDPKTQASAWMIVTGYLKHSNDKRLFTVTFSSGRHVTVTEDHSLITLNDKGELSPIYPLDCVIGQTRSPVAMLPEVPVQVTMSHDMGLFAGLYLSEGHCPPSQPGLVIIAVQPDNRAEEVISLLRKVTNGREPYRNGGSVCLTDHALCDWLTSSFGHLAHNKRIPEKYLSASNEFKQGLISGYFGGDGCVWSDSNGAIQLGAASVSKQLRDDLCDLLASLGIFTTRAHKEQRLENTNWRDVYSLRVISRHLGKLDSWFFYADKQARFASKLKKKFRASPFESVPVTKAGRKAMYKEFESASMFRYKTASLGFVAKDRLREGSGTYGKWGRSDVMWDLITDITPHPNEDFVYDLCVEGSENFAVCGGLIVHNTFLHNTPVVKIGDAVGKGQLLAKSNYTDDKGQIAMGTNLRTGYMPYKGLAFEDGVIISESAAQRLRSEHMYQRVLEHTPGETVLGRKQFLSLYPGAYKPNQLKPIDENGVVKVGTVVKHGDPLFLSLRRSQQDAVHKGHKPMFSNGAMEWDHVHDGVVTDVTQNKNGDWNITVKSHAPAQEGDKLAGFFGDKGVISRVIPDHQMPHSKDGKPLELILNSLGIISRINPSQVYEALLGKIARKTGQPVLLPGFGLKGKASVDHVQEELAKHGLKDTEDLVDPETGKSIPGVLTGERFMMKLHHLAEGKGKGRDVGGYTSEGLPARGGDEGAKRISQMETFSLLSHGVPNVLREAQVIRGQRNDDYWKAFRMGLTPPSPKEPLIYNKFLAHLKGAGINVEKDGNKLHLFALTDKHVDEMSSGEIKENKTVDQNDMTEIPGGLFDRTITGGHGGNRWGHINLHEPMPNPVFEEPVRRMLGLTGKKFEAILGGQEQLGGATGPKAIQAALGRINVDGEIERYKSIIKDGAKSKRDNAVKVLGYLETLKKEGTHPKELMMNKVPVIPPNFRPITKFKDLPLVADANLLYKDLMTSNQALKDLSGQVGDEHLNEERLQLYNAVKAVSGLGDPVQEKTQEKKVKGLLAHVFGNSPKMGMFQRRVLGMPVDMVGRAAITPNPDLSMDEVGLPEPKAWTIYRPFIVRRLIRQGLPAVEAAKSVANQTDLARKTMLEEMKERPVMINRAPTYHRYGFMAAFPKLSKGHTLQLPPVVCNGFNADFDGDAMNYHVPVTEEAVKEAREKMLPSVNLKSTRDFGVHYLPRNEFLMGLYLASNSKNDKPPRVFRSKADVIAAYQRGDIDIHDKVVVKG
jgi:DNA-directed RNA polymerase beta subunit